MSNPFADAIVRAGTYVPAKSDYVGQDGLWYCGKCHTPRQTVITEDNIFKGLVLPVICRCMKDEMLSGERRKETDRIRDMRERAFSDPAQYDWTFENDNGKNPKMAVALRYCDKWEKEVFPKNYGLLLSGGVGCGKSYMAGCIANRLVSEGVSVKMTNFSQIINDMIGMTAGKNEYLSHLCSHSLLILDDFGSERKTEYAWEQIYNVIDARYRSRKPLILTTNMTLYEFQHPGDLMHSRIYDRILEMCCPVSFSGESMRKSNMVEKFSRLL